MSRYLKIKKGGITTNEVEVDNLKQAKQLASTLPDYHGETIVYATINQITRVENTIILKR